MVESTRPPIVFRGSRRRLRQIRFRGNWSAEMSWLAIWIVVVLCLILPWLVRSADRASGIAVQPRRPPTVVTSDDP
jgi:hypothetical protein